MLSILFLLLCGCKSPSEIVSDFNDFLDSGITKTYESINRVVSEAVSEVVEDSGIDKNDIVTITPIEVTLSTGELSAYNKLNSKQKKLYAVMLAAVNDMELRNIKVTKYLSEDGFSDSIIVHRAVMCDHPEIFWMPKTITYLSLENRPDKYIAFKDYYGERDDKGFYGITKSEKEAMENNFNAAVNKALAGAKNLGSFFEKELYLHDYICNVTTYDSESASNLENANPNSMTAYGALVEGKAICEGYSKAMQLLCNKCSIPCNVIFGEHEGVPHMWNIINPGDGLYYLDTTFDDCSSEHILHIYFNVTKDSILKDRNFDEPFSQGNKYDGSYSFNFFDSDCRSTALNYFERNGAYIDYDCTAAINCILAAAQEGKNSSELKNRTDLSSQKAFDLLCKRARGIIDFQYCYRYDNENIIIAVW